MAEMIILENNNKNKINREIERRKRRKEKSVFNCLKYRGTTDLRSIIMSLIRLSCFY